MAKATEKDVTETVGDVEPKAVEKVGAMIYYGPNLPGGILTQYTVFKGGMPEHIVKLYPAITKCFTAVSNSAALMKNLSDPHSIENANISAVRSTLTKGK